MIDRLIQHAEIPSFEGDSYRLRGKEFDARQIVAPSSPDRRQNQRHDSR